MRFDKEQHHRRSIRLQDYDYSQAGAYFVTACAWKRECLFGDIMEGKVQLNGYGETVKRYWNAIPQHFQNTEIYEFVIMPNHVHGIVVIRTGTDVDVVAHSVGAIHELPLQNRANRRRMTIPKIIGRFKMNTAKQINQIRNTPGMPVWQRNYYEHIIRDEDDLSRIRQYIAENPFKWDEDENNPANVRNTINEGNLRRGNS